VGDVGHKILSQGLEPLLPGDIVEHEQRPRALLSVERRDERARASTQVEFVPPTNSIARCGSVRRYGPRRRSDKLLALQHTLQPWWRAIRACGKIALERAIREQI